MSGCSAVPSGPPPNSGTPLEGLTKEELANFYTSQQKFMHQFTVKEGLGPLFNDQSCFACHGSPGMAGGPGTDLVKTQCTRIARRKPHTFAAKLPKSRAMTDVYSIDIDDMTQFGGPVLARKSVTTEFASLFADPNGAILPPTVPSEAEFVSTRQAGQLFGAGLLQAVPDDTLDKIQRKQRKEFPLVAGRCAALLNQYQEQQSYGRFGWKAQHHSLLSFTIEAMQMEMGITTPPEPLMKTTSALGDTIPALTAQLPKNPENDGRLACELAYYMALLAPPARGEITPDATAGEGVFTKLGCAVCHMPSLTTADKVMIPAPDGTLPDVPSLKSKHGPLWYLEKDAAVKLVEVKALEHKELRAYTDLLIHKLGSKLADGIPQGVGGGDYWRTTPLWGLRNRRFLLHDGRTTDLNEAIEAHGGQAQQSVDAYQKLGAAEKEQLMQFLHSL